MQEGGSWLLRACASCGRAVVLRRLCFCWDWKIRETPSRQQKMACTITDERAQPTNSQQTAKASQTIVSLQTRG